MGYVKTLYIDGLKRFEHFKIEFNEHLSILVGDNCTGMQTSLFCKICLIWKTLELFKIILT